jgi:predicted phage-related endonuclease
MFSNDRMKRGLELESIARELFTIQNGIEMFPRVVINDWAMASLDGMSDCRQYILEIKCPGEKDHALALQGKVPEYYYPQLQHALYVTGVDSIFYYSFDGTDGVTLIVKRDEKYIEKMVEEERKFYDCIINKTPPESDYIQRDDYLWTQCALEWKSVNQQLKQLEKQENDLRDQLIFLGGELSCKGAGVSLCQVQRKGFVDYTKIPELKGIDLDQYRKPETTSWRITAQ